MGYSRIKLHKLYQSGSRLVLAKWSFFLTALNRLVDKSGTNYWRALIKVDDYIWNVPTCSDKYDIVGKALLRNKLLQGRKQQLVAAWNNETLLWQLDHRLTSSQNLCELSGFYECSGHIWWSEIQFHHAFRTQVYISCTASLPQLFPSHEQRLPRCTSNLYKKKLGKREGSRSSDDKTVIRSFSARLYKFMIGRTEAS